MVCVCHDLNILGFPVSFEVKPFVVFSGSHRKTVVVPGIENQWEIHWKFISKRLRYAFIHKNWRPETKKYDMSLGSANFSDVYWKLASGKLTVCY
jgi:hypothetical protein